MIKPSILLLAFIVFVVSLIEICIQIRRLKKFKAKAKAYGIDLKKL